MQDRSAYSSISGYYYQFLSTIKDILSTETNNDITIEGIEDLDIMSPNEQKLIQYKYHEEKGYSNSQVAKPIALMFNHFLDNKSANISYELHIYLGNSDKLPDLTTNLLQDILKLESSIKYISDSNQNSINVYQDVNNFNNKFSWLLTDKFTQLEQVILDLIGNIFSVTQTEAKIVHLTNALHLVIELSKKRDVNDRKITKQIFIDNLKNKHNILYSNFMTIHLGFDKFSKYFIKSIQKRNASNYVVEICNYSRANLSSFIVDLAKQNVFAGKNKDNRPILFIINSTIDEYKSIKKSIYNYINSLNETIIINDGNEDYVFIQQNFTRPMFCTGNSKKINLCNFNFYLLHKDTYDNNKNDICSVLSNISLFVIDSDTSNLEIYTNKKYFLNNLDNSQLLQLIGKDK